LNGSGPAVNDTEVTFPGLAVVAAGVGVEPYLPCTGPAILLALLLHGGVSSPVRTDDPPPTAAWDEECWPERLSSVDPAADEEPSEAVSSAEELSLVPLPVGASV